VETVISGIFAELGGFRSLFFLYLLRPPVDLSWLIKYLSSLLLPGFSGPLFALTLRQTMKIDLTFCAAKRLTSISPRSAICQGQRTLAPGGMSEMKEKGYEKSA
jgi:hypothetical protein